MRSFATYSAAVFAQILVEKALLTIPLRPRRFSRRTSSKFINPVLDLFQTNLESVKSLEIARRISIVRSSVGVASFVNAAIAFLTSSVQSHARSELYSL